MATSALGVLMCLGFLDRLDNFGLDLHVRHAGRIDTDPAILMIDLDDTSLTQVGRWPWPRRKLAQLVRTLKEMGAGAIVLDAVLSEPAAPRSEHAGLGLHYDADSELSEQGDRASDPIILDDDELAAAIRDAGNVYLAMYFDAESLIDDVAGVYEKAFLAVRSDPTIDQDRFVEKANPPPGWSVDEMFLRMRMATKLTDDFTLDIETLSQRVFAAGRMPSDSPKYRALEANLPWAKRWVARRTVKQFFESQPAGTWRLFYDHVQPHVPFDLLNADRNDLLLAYRARRAELAVLRSCFPAPDQVFGRIPMVDQIHLPLDKFASAAKGVGLVSYVRDDPSGVVRSVPLSAIFEGRLLLQLGFLVAADFARMDRSTIRLHEDAMVVRRDAEELRLPLQSDGTTLINWHASAGGDWRNSFTHLPAVRFVEMVHLREAIDHNLRHLAIALGQLVEIRHRETPGEFERYATMVREFQTLRATVLPGIRILAQESTRRSSQLSKDIHQMELEALTWLQRTWSLWKKETPKNDEERSERERIRSLQEKFADEKLQKSTTEGNRALEHAASLRQKELEPCVKGKICFVGLTATATADLIATPISGTVPGVLAHANIANMVLRGQTIRRIDPQANLLILAAAGLVVALVTGAQGPIVSLLFLFLMVFGIGMGGAHAFATQGVHIATLPACLAAVASWATVTLFRQCTEQKARRAFQRALSQYTSPAIASRISTRLDSHALVPRAAKVTCFFADLAGFTRLSERLGAEDTRALLNPYLDAMSRALVDRQGLVNKFMGDGVFAFFNAPLLTCSRHAESACAAALTACDAIRRMNEESPLARLHGPLVVRIGISTGEAFVGDYGSDSKLDYTCIGDTVNVGGRLEQTNKLTGTTILVDDATRREAGDGLIFRNLGWIPVPGRDAPVHAHELCRRAEEGEPKLIDYIRLFETAVAHYQSYEWTTCLAVLKECSQIDPEDTAVSWLEKRVREELCR